jgi:hypothetical protein
MLFNTTFKNSLVISRRPVLLVEETEENHGPGNNAASPLRGATYPKGRTNKNVPHP